ncbi:unnamed protein product, partial [Ectocarpus sp. 6 AP-2014]
KEEVRGACQRRGARGAVLTWAGLRGRRFPPANDKRFDGAEEPDDTTVSALEKSTNATR